MSSAISKDSQLDLLRITNQKGGEEKNCTEEEILNIEKSNEYKNKNNEIIKEKRKNLNNFFKPFYDSNNKFNDFINLFDSEKEKSFDNLDNNPIGITNIYDSYLNKINDLFNTNKLGNLIVFDGRKSDQNEDIYNGTYDDYFYEVAFEDNKNTNTYTNKNKNTDTIILKFKYRTKIIDSKYKEKGEENTNDYGSIEYKIYPDEDNYKLKINGENIEFKYINIINLHYNKLIATQSYKAVYNKVSECEVELSNKIDNIKIIDDIEKIKIIYNNIHIEKIKQIKTNLMDLMDKKKLR